MAEPPTAPLRVLVIDDSRAQRMLLVSLLRRWGHDVVECGHRGRGADRRAVTPEIGLVISDWVMPGLTGPEFCRRLRADGRAGYAYVILLTSKTEDTALAEGLEAGADDFLTKPVRPPGVARPASMRAPASSRCTATSCRRTPF